MFSLLCPSVMITPITRSNTADWCASLPFTFILGRILIAAGDSGVTDMGTGICANQKGLSFQLHNFLDSFEFVGLCLACFDSIRLVC